MNVKKNFKISYAEIATQNYLHSNYSKYSLNKVMKSQFECYILVVKCKLKA